MTGRLITSETKFAARNPFDKFKHEEPQEERKLVVKPRSPGLAQLLNRWEMFLGRIETPPERNPFLRLWDKFTERPRRLDMMVGDSYHWAYLRAMKLLRRTNYSATDVEALSVALVDYQDTGNISEAAGIFLSAAINRGKKGATYVIHTKHMQDSFEYFGLYNIRNILIKGDAMHYTAVGMKKGKITIEGFVSQNAHLGDAMKGGEIVLLGGPDDVYNAPYNTVHRHWVFRLGEIGRDTKAKIYHRDRLIFDGKRHGYIRNPPSNEGK